MAHHWRNPEPASGATAPDSGRTVRHTRREGRGDGGENGKLVYEASKAHVLACLYKHVVSF